MHQPEHSPPVSKIWPRVQAGILIAFLLLAYVYVWTIQPGYGPDEPRHLAFVKRLVEKGQLPRLVGEAEEDGAIALHPPVYYTVMAPVYAATRGLGDESANRVIKHFSPLIVGGALLLFLGTLRRLFPNRPFAVTAALAIVALLPEFQLEASVMNNDSLAVLMGSLLLWHLVRIWDRAPSSRDALISGLIMAAFVNTKATGWMLVPLWLFVLALRWRNQGGRIAPWVRDLAIGYGIVVLLGTWWYIRNYQLYGQVVPIPVEYLGRSLRPFNLTDGKPLTAAEVYSTGAVLPWGWRAFAGLFHSFWVQIDWVPEHLRAEMQPNGPVSEFDLSPLNWGPVFNAFVVLVLAAVPGWIAALAPVMKTAVQQKKGASFRWSPLWMLAAAFFAIWFSTWYTATFIHIGFYQGGRYLMPVAFAAGALLAFGWERLCPAKARLPFVLVLCMALIGFNVMCLHELITVLNPKYVV
jgi:hypothetical protein